MNTATAALRNNLPLVIGGVILLALIVLLIVVVASGAAECPAGQTVVDYITIEMGDIDVQTPVCG